MMYSKCHLSWARMEFHSVSISFGTFDSRHVLQMCVQTGTTCGNYMNKESPLLKLPTGQSQPSFLTTKSLVQLQSAHLFTKHGILMFIIHSKTVSDVFTLQCEQLVSSFNMHCHRPTRSKLGLTLTGLNRT